MQKYVNFPRAIRCSFLAVNVPVLTDEGFGPAAHRWHPDGRWAQDNGWLRMNVDSWATVGQPQPRVVIWWPCAVCHGKLIWQREARGRRHTCGNADSNRDTDWLMWCQEDWGGGGVLMKTLCMSIKQLASFFRIGIRELVWRVVETDTLFRSESSVTLCWDVQDRDTELLRC